MPRLLPLVATLAAGSLLAAPGLALATGADTPPRCAPGGDAVVLDGTVAAEDAKTYLLLPFEVAPGTTRVEVAYDWADLDPALGSLPQQDTVVDLGLWDEDGTSGADAFRGWGGSRQGVIGRGMDPVWVQADSADRGFTPGTVEPGTWHVELGFGNVNQGGGSWHVEVTCLDPVVGPEPVADPVDPTHVASPTPGWYHADFHMHAFHSNPNGPTPADVVEHAREVGLDVLPITEYVTTRHHGEWGAVARANPDVIVWPGREVITYFGHANVLGETPDVVEYRHGLDGISLGDVQRDSVAAGALFQINHPTIFPDPVFTSFCRGCAFNLEGDVDPLLVDTVEVLTGPIEVDPSYVGLPSGPGIEQPFVATAIEFYEDLLRQGAFVAPVSGSDEKQAEGHGSSATAIRADELSRPGIVDAIRAGRTYVRTRGVADSPAIEVTATDGTDTVELGGTLVADTATLDVTVTGGAGQVLELTRDGQPVASLPIASDDESFSLPIARTPREGPLGTFHRVDVREASGIRSVIGSAIFLTGDPLTPAADDPDEADTVGAVDGDRTAEPDAPRGAAARGLAATGGGAATATFGLAAAALAVRLRRR